MKDAGCRLMIVGYESGDQQILKNIKKGATVEGAKRFTQQAHKLGLTIHADFIVGLPGETRESIRKTIDFAKNLDCETIQVSIAHAYPGTEFYDFAKQNALINIGHMSDEQGHQLPHVIYPGILEESEMMEWVNALRRIFRPKAAWLGQAPDNSERSASGGSPLTALRSKRKKYITDMKAGSASA
jgi:radical SAM superfamily enzyme YgiQ (UPF0313 family)